MQNNIQKTVSFLVVFSMVFSLCAPSLLQAGTNYDSLKADIRNALSVTKSNVSNALTNMSYNLEQKLKTTAQYMIDNPSVLGRTIAGGVLGGVLGATLGPVGIFAGAIGGMAMGATLDKWSESSSLDTATLVGAAVGGVLTAGIGFPALALGIIGGGILGRLAHPSIKLFAENIKDTMSYKRQRDSIPANGLNRPPALSSTAYHPEDLGINDPQVAYSKYAAAYSDYMSALAANNTEKAKNSYNEYIKYYDLYTYLTQK